MQEEPAPLTELAPELPNPYVHVIERTLAKEPADRFQSAGELLGALRLARAAGLAPRPAERPAERSGPGTGRDATRIPARTVTRAPERGSMSRATPGHGARNLVIGLLAALVVVLLGYLVLRPSLGGRREAEPPPQVAALLKDAIATRVQLAQRRLDSGDYAAAVRDAESALKLDPANAEAKAILDEASDGARRSEPAARALQQAQAQGGDVTAAAFELMKVDPANAEAQKAVAGAGAAFRPRAEEAQRLAAEAQRAADAAGAARQPAFTAAVALVEQGQQALQSGQFATAARRFLEARIRFERAGRAPKSP
jgi:serine/threonine-protein kinase